MLSGIDIDLIFSKIIEKINTIEGSGILAIYDTIVEKTGKNSDVLRYTFCNIFPFRQLGIYPISAEIYRSKEKLDNKNRDTLQRLRYRKKLLRNVSWQGCISHQ